jgi:hypothetical protein
MNDNSTIHNKSTYPFLRTLITVMQVSYLLGKRERENDRKKDMDGLITSSSLAL